MFTRERAKKVGSSPSVANPQNRLFMVLRSKVAFQPALVTTEGINQEQLKESRIAIEKAMLQLEYDRAKAMMTSQQARSFY
jgi:hypothetical protein